METGHHIFNLPSGIECEIKELDGSHQSILTKGGNKNIEKKLFEMLKDIVVRIGSKNRPEEEDILRILAADKKHILVMARQFALDFDPVFRFDYEYKKDDGTKGKEEFEIPIPENGLPVRPYMVEVKEGKEVKFVPASYAELDDIVKTVELTLPRSGKIVRYDLLDGYGERRGSSVGKNERDVNTPLRMRNLRTFKKSSDGKTEIPVSLDPNKMSLKDIEFVRADIKKREGQVDTEVIIEHPETGEEKIIDALGQVAFFFPSQAI